ncbi:Pentatricopeptide repeat-containing protein [Nymphaea thermarum]|nr:Pentatricopeptide repeat-containing protein [Nymphaea thermarum]
MVTINEGEQWELMVDEECNTHLLERGFDDRSAQMTSAEAMDFFRPVVQTKRSLQTDGNKSAVFVVTSLVSTGNHGSPSTCEDDMYECVLGSATDLLCLPYRALIHGCPCAPEVSVSTRLGTGTVKSPCFGFLAPQSVMADENQPILFPRSSAVINCVSEASYSFVNSISSNLSTCINLLRKATDTGQLKDGKMVHAHMLRTRLEVSLVEANTLVNFYAKCGFMAFACQVFYGMHEKNVVSWCSLMAGYLRNGHAREVLTLFEMMVVDGLKPNHFVLSMVLRSCSALMDFSRGKQLHAYALKHGFISYMYVQNAILVMYCKSGGLEESLKFYHGMKEQDVSSSNVMISAFLKHGCHVEALEFLRRSLVNHKGWDDITHVTALNLCSCMNYLRLGQEVHNQILKAHKERNIFVGSALVDMYGKCGKFEYACKIFELLSQRNIVLWTALTAAYAQNGLFEEALSLLSDMCFEGVQPNEFTYAALLNSCACLAALDHGTQLHSLAKKMGYSMCLPVGNALIIMYSKSGNIGYARKVFDCMANRDVISWNSMISGYSQHGLGEQALQIFHHMLLTDKAPTHVTFVGVLSACGHIGLVNEGFYYFNHLMKKFNVVHGVEHYTCMVGLLGRAGLLDEAYSLIKSMPVHCDVVVWRTLLNACQVYKNANLGKKIAGLILQSYPHDAGTYILISNIYAKSTRWTEVTEIREKMKAKDVKKEPGVSWIQVQNCTHVFVSKDREHPQLRQIHEKLAEVLAEIRVVGYVPDMSSVLHDVDDEQKEECLRYHSEKLAVSFGLISSPPGATIRIFKNLRVCDDCHVAMKFISVTTKREIILRDANRFEILVSPQKCLDAPESIIQQPLEVVLPAEYAEFVIAVDADEVEGVAFDLCSLIKSISAGLKLRDVASTEAAVRFAVGAILIDCVFGVELDENVIIEDLGLFLYHGKSLVHFFLLQMRLGQKALSFSRMEEE